MAVLEPPRILDEGTKKWFDANETEESRVRTSVLDGALYVLGGLNDGELIRKLERLDVQARDRWVPARASKLGTCVEGS